ncbi:hypothetical protein [Bacillus sp. D48C]
MYRKIHGKLFWCVEVPSEVKDDCPQLTSWSDQISSHKGSIAGIVINYYEAEPGEGGDGPGEGGDHMDPAGPGGESPHDDPRGPAEPPETGLVINYYTKR